MTRERGVLGFGGEVAEFYQRYRRGYPAEVVDGLAAAFGLGGSDLVLDLGCGTGQLTLPLAGRVRAVLGMDPEPDMLAQARRAAGPEVANVSWLLGSDADLPALGTLLGGGALGAVTVGQALHWMDHERVFRTLPGLLRPGGGVAVVSNGIPLWSQGSPWSDALRGCLERWLGTGLTGTCGTDEADRERYRSALAVAGFEVAQTELEYQAELELDQIVGGVCSAMVVDQLPAPDRRAELADRIAEALDAHRPWIERVPVVTLTGTLP